MNELTICLKTPDKKLIEKHLDYKGTHLHPLNADLKQLVDEAIIKFKAASDIDDIDEPEIIIKATMVWKQLYG